MTNPNEVTAETVARFQILQAQGGTQYALEVFAQSRSATSDAAMLLKLPEPGKCVLAWTELVSTPIRAMWVPAKHLEASDDGDFGEYDEVTDMFYWPEGWYEHNRYEETHWRVTDAVIEWQPLPSRAAIAAGGSQNG